MEERQRLKLTGTNSSIGLIVLITYIHQGAIRRIVAQSRMVYQRSRMSGPFGAYAPRGRRTTGDAQSRLRASPVCNGLFSLTLVPPCGRRYVGAAHRRRRSVDLAKLRFEGRQAKRTSKAQRRRSSDRRCDDPWIALEQLLDLNMRFADLVVMAERLHPIPFRTRP